MAGLSSVDEPRRRAPAPPARTTAPAAGLSAAAPATAAPAWQTDPFWNSLKWDSSQIGSKEDIPVQEDIRGGRGSLHTAWVANAQQDSAEAVSALSANFAGTPYEGRGAGQYLGSKGGVLPIAGKPGYYKIMQQPIGNKSYNLYSAEYKVSADGKSLERVSDWSFTPVGSDTKFYQDAGKKIAVLAGAAYGAGAMSGTEAAGAGAAGEAAGGLGAAEGVGAAAGAGGAGAGAGMGIGEIGASQLTPALMESAVGTSGYGLSSAGLGYVGAAAGAGGVAPFNTAASNPALIDSALGTSGYGTSSATPGFSAASGGLSASDYQKLGQQVSKMGQGGGQGGGSGSGSDGAEPIPVMTAEEWARYQALQEQGIAQSSKAVKTKPKGLAAADPISQNGQQIAGIQEMVRELADIKKRIAALKARKGRK